MVTQAQQQMFAERLRAQEQARPGYRDRMNELERQLLQHGGLIMVPPMQAEPEWLIALLLAEGAVETLKASRVGGESNECHSNCMRRIALTEEPMQWRTGYALSDDGLWRQHSWLRTDQGLLETTTLRRSYWGVTVHETTARKEQQMGERAGQAAFNRLAETEPEIAELIRGTDADPYYDDRRLERFHTETARLRQQKKGRS